MKKGILAVSCLLGILLNSCAIYVHDDDDDNKKRTTNTEDNDTIIIIHSSIAKGPLEP